MAHLSGVLPFLLGVLAGAREIEGLFVEVEAALRELLALAQLIAKELDPAVLIEELLIEVLRTKQARLLSSLLFCR